MYSYCTNYTSIVLKYFERMCQCGVHTHDPVVVETWQSIIDENIPHTEESIRVGLYFVP